MPRVSTDSDIERIRAELALSSRFRAEGRLGRARVCARRAAGWAIAHYYRRARGTPMPSSALVLLRLYRDDPAVPVGLRQAAARLIVPVGEDFRLPHDEDSTEDARRLVEHLLADEATS